MSTGDHIATGAILAGHVQNAAKEIGTKAKGIFGPPELKDEKVTAGSTWLEYDASGHADSDGNDVPFMSVMRGTEAFAYKNFLHLNGSEIAITRDASLDMQGGKVENVGPGEVSGASTDAINGSQLHTALAGVTRKRRITNQTGTNLEFAAQAPVSAIIYDAAGVNVTNARGVVLSKNQVKAGTVSAMMATDELYIVE